MPAQESDNVGMTFRCSWLASESQWYALVAAFVCTYDSFCPASAQWMTGLVSRMAGSASIIWLLRCGLLLVIVVAFTCNSKLSRSKPKCTDSVCVLDSDVSTIWLLWCSMAFQPFQ